MGDRSRKAIALAEKYGAHNYHPLPVVITRAKGPFVWDAEGKRFYDFLAAYSALNQGHNHPRIVAAARKQLGKVALTSRAFHNELLGPFLERLCALTGQDRALLMNSGTEAVETAIKAMRLWGYQRKGVGEDQAEILVCANNFHGRTTTIVGFSSDPASSTGFGPATPGFRVIAYGDADALKSAIGRNTVGFLFEPIQGEAGVVIPPKGYLKAVRRFCSMYNVLMCADEIQTGLGRTGRMFACDHEGVKPDLLVLGKALSGGLYPISALVGEEEVMSLFTPGTHGSTFGGNPLACAIGLAALDVIRGEDLARKSAKVGAVLLARLKTLHHPALKEARGRGLMLALEFTSRVRPLVEDLMRRGLLAKDTHENTIRLAPPLVISEPQAEAAFRLIRDAVAAFKG
ncbi:MAG TPA: ornithine--oxo-acid transaminase [Elusimicrobia bacterium]|nr:MAG: ornithine--oxo-acid transaminase [Elusimicrobia bacterium GWA2_66_18]HAZ08119.1 ornithine--oxo-acid transaminase [Elusimicrobiota bacterium]